MPSAEALSLSLIHIFGEDGSDHICGLTAEVCVIDAVAEERAVEGEGIGAGVVRDACVGKGLVNSELCLHDGVIGRGEHGVYTVGNECLCGCLLYTSFAFYVTP